MPRDVVRQRLKQGGGFTNPVRQGGAVQITKDLVEPITGRDVIVVEDIVDIGMTLNTLLETLDA